MASEDDIAFEAMTKATESKADILTRSDIIGIYEGAMRQLEKSQNKLGRMVSKGSDRENLQRADNPYYIELLNQYPDFYAWEERLGSYNVGDQKHGTVPRMIHKGYDDDKWIPRFEEAKKDPNYYNEATMDSLVQAFGFDKLNKRKKK